MRGAKADTPLCQIPCNPSSAKKSQSQSFGSGLPLRSVAARCWSSVETCWKIANR